MKRRRKKSGQNRIRMWFHWLLKLMSQTELCSNKYKYLVYRQAHTAGLNSGTHGLSQSGETVLLHLMLGSTFNSHLFLQWDQRQTFSCCISNDKATGVHIIELYMLSDSKYSVLAKPSALTSGCSFETLPLIAKTAATWKLNVYKGGLGT